MHVEYVVEKGRNIFMEKSFAVDGPGIRRILAAGKKAEEKGIKIAGGLMSRHYTPLEDVIKRVHDGAIGDVITCWAYREHGPVGFTPKSEGNDRPGQPDPQLQLLHLGKRELPSRLADPQSGRVLLGQGSLARLGAGSRWTSGSQARRPALRSLRRGIHVPGRYAFIRPGASHDRLLGFLWRRDPRHEGGPRFLAKGFKVPVIYKSHKQAKDNILWQYDGPSVNAYDVEHQLLFDAIRQQQAL